MTKIQTFQGIVVYDHEDKRFWKAREIIDLAREFWDDGYYCGSAGHVSQDKVKRYIQEQEGKKPFDYDIYECPEELKGQLKLGDFYG